MSCNIVLTTSQGETLRRAVLALLAAGMYTILCWRPEWMALFGVSHLGVWFLDTRALLAASDAVAIGLSPYAENPLDLFNQPHVYSSWWFGLSKIGLTRFDHVWLGAVLGFSFLLVALLQLRARSMPEILWSAAILISPPFVLGFNRGNADLLVFIVLSTTVPCLLATRAWVRWVGFASILVAAGFKFYPITAVPVLLRANGTRREVWLMIFSLTLLAGALVIDQQESLRSFINDPQTPNGFFTFGFAVTAQLLRLSGEISALVVMTLLVGAIAATWRIMPDWAPSPSEQQDYLRFILGATLWTACYFATANYTYRAVVAVWMAPFLWRAWKKTDWPDCYRRLSRIVAVLLLSLLWSDGLTCMLINFPQLPLSGPVARLSEEIMLVQQPLIAALALGFMGFLVPFGRRALEHLIAPPWRRNGKISPQR